MCAWPKHKRVGQALLLVGFWSTMQQAPERQEASAAPTPNAMPLASKALMGEEELFAQQGQ